MRLKVALAAEAAPTISGAPGVEPRKLQDRKTDCRCAMEHTKLARPLGPLRTAEKHALNADRLKAVGLDLEDGTKLVRVRLAPGITAPVGSETKPEMDVDWPNTNDTVSKSATRRRQRPGRPQDLQTTPPRVGFAGESLRTVARKMCTVEPLF